MFKDKTQQLAHDGNREALREIYNDYSREVYAMIHAALIDDESTRAATKQVFLNLFREIMHGESDIRIAARLTELTNDEIRISRIAGGDLSKEALRSDFHLTERTQDDVEDETDDENDDEEFLDEPAPRPYKKNYADKSSKSAPKKTNGFLNVFSVVLLVVLILIFLWLVAGILMDYQIIPYFNLGYSWFNEHVFRLFQLTSVQ